MTIISEFMMYFQCHKQQAAFQSNQSIQYFNRRWLSYSMLQEEWKIALDGITHIHLMVAGYQAVPSILCLVDINT